MKNENSRLRDILFSTFLLVLIIKIGGRGDHSPTKNNGISLCNRRVDQTTDILVGRCLGAAVMKGNQSACSLCAVGALHEALETMEFSHRDGTSSIVYDGGWGVLLLSIIL